MNTLGARRRVVKIKKDVRNKEKINDKNQTEMINIDLLAYIQ